MLSGVPIVTQQVKNLTQSPWGCRFDPLALLSGLRIWQSHKPDHRCGSDPVLPWLWHKPELQPQFDPWPGTSICHKCGCKKKKEKTNKQTKNMLSEGPKRAYTFGTVWSSRTGKTNPCMVEKKSQRWLSRAGSSGAETDWKGGDENVLCHEGPSYTHACICQHSVNIHLRFEISCMFYLNQENS